MLKSYKAPIEESEKTQVLILGSGHLGNLGQQFRPALLDSLIEVLRGYSPDVIGVESLPSQVIVGMEAAPEKYRQALEIFAKDRLELARRAREALGVSRTEAEGRAKGLLEQAVRGGLSPEGRLDLALNLLAAYEVESAVLQWSYLPEVGQERLSTMDGGLAGQFDALLNSPVESFSIGVRLARVLGLQSIACIDDQQDTDIYFEIADRLEPELERIGYHTAIRESEIIRKHQESSRRAVEAGDLLPHYRFMNSPEYVHAIMDAEYVSYLRPKLPSRLERTRLAQLEVRNLNMASHIRRASARHPGQRMLVIVGASHKPLLDLYLSQMLDVKLVHLGELL